MLTSGNGIANRYGYDQVMRRLTDVAADSFGTLEHQQGRAPTPFHRLHYDYDAVGNIVRMQNQVSLQPWRNAAVFVGPHDVTYSYDNLYQLKTLTGKDRPHVGYGYQYSDSYSYGELGNIIKKSQSQDRLVWDNQNVTPTTNPAQAIAQLNGSRFDHNVSALTYTLDYQYVGAHPHAASTVNETLANQAPSPRAVTYDANGNNLGNSFKGTNRTQVWDEEDRLKREYLFTSKEWDVDTSLYYYGARYFDPHTDVWQSTDPALADYMAGVEWGGAHTPSNLALYTYSRNNPVVLRDPDGRIAPLIAAGIALLVGGGAAAGIRTVQNLLGGRPAGEGVPGAVAGTMVSGAMLLASGGTTFGTQMATGAIAGIAGGGVQRAVDTGDSQMSWANMSVDASWGMVAGSMMSGRPPEAISPSSPTTSAAAMGGAKPLAEQAAELVPQNGGRSRVTLDSPSQRIELDLTGKPHAGVPTPHTKVSPRDTEAPEHLQPAYNTRRAATVPATEQDIRMVRRYLERQGN